MTLIDQLLEDGFDTVGKLRAERDALAAECALYRDRLRRLYDCATAEAIGPAGPSDWTSRVIQLTSWGLANPLPLVARVVVEAAQEIELRDSPRTWAALSAALRNFEEK